MGDLGLRDLVAVVAILISGGALWLGAVNYRRARRLDERDLFLRIHELLLDPEVVAGRRALYGIKSAVDAEQTEYRPDEMTQIYRHWRCTTYWRFMSRTDGSTKRR